MSEPYIEDGWLFEPCEPDYAPGISQAIPGSWEKPLVDLTTLEGYDALIAAAEQRGAKRAFRKTQEIIAGFDHTIDEARNRDDMINTGHLIQVIDTEIQDLMEGNDD